MTGQGNLAFQNNTIPPPAPAGLQFADEGLAVEGGDTVVLGKDIAAGAYPVFSNDRVINTQGFSLKFYDAEPANIFMDLYPGFLQITNNVSGGGAFFNDTLFNIFDNFGQISAGISGVNGFICDVYPGAVSSPQITLRNSRFAGTNYSVYAFDEGTAVPKIDETILVDIQGKGMRWGADNIFGDTYFGFGWQSPLNPFTQDVFWMDLADIDSMAYFEERQNPFKSALTVRNQLPGSRDVLNVVGGENQLNVQTNDSSGFAIARINLLDPTETSRGFLEWEEIGDSVALYGNEVRLNSMAGIMVVVNPSGNVNFTQSVFVGDQIQNPTAKVDIKGQDVNPNSAPLKLQPGGALMAVPEDGAFEYDGTDLYFTVGLTRKLVSLI